MTDENIVDTRTERVKTKNGKWGALCSVVFEINKE